ncbi:MAG: Ribonuclease Z [Chlamydiae bacterium]|nr:Ribonuclease Z [Chlamydiota bacterium]
MELECIGVGEAFEPQLGNTSFLLHSETNLLIDCGYAVPRNLFSRNYPPDLIDALYVTHFHADHFFGVPAMVYRWQEEGRKKPLTIIGQPGTKSLINRTIDLGYPSCRSKLDFELKYLETTDPVALNELSLSFAQTDHSMKNYAIKITKGKSSIGISGDGGLTTKTRDLFQDCTVLVHEAYTYDRAIQGHTYALDIVAFAKGLPTLQTLALVHIQRDERANRLSEFTALQKDVPFKLLAPEPGERIFLKT